MTITIITIRENEYVDKKALSLFVGTYNVNAKKLDGSLNELLLKSGKRCLYY